MLRGALDGLAAVPPYGDRDYAGQRGGLAFPARRGGCLDLDGHFGLHPRLERPAPSLAGARSRHPCRGHLLSCRPHFKAARTCWRQAAARTLADGCSIGRWQPCAGDGRALGGVGPATPLIPAGRPGCSCEPQQIIAPAVRISSAVSPISTGRIPVPSSPGGRAPGQAAGSDGRPGSKPMPGAQYLIAAAEGWGGCWPIPAPVAVLEAHGLGYPVIRAGEEARSPMRSRGGDRASSS